MGRIPQYDQNQLASSVVGTPGVDESGAKLFNSLSNETDQVTTGLMTVARANQVEAVRLQRQQQRQAQAIAKAQTQLEVSQKGLALTGQLYGIQGEIEKNYTGDPEQAPEQFMKQGQKAISDYVSTITNPQVRLGVEKAGNETLKARLGVNSNWAQKQRTDNAVAGTVTAQSTLVNIAGRTDSVEELGKLWQQADTLAAGSQWALGEKAPKFARDTKAQMTKQFLSNMLIKDWRRVLPTINSGAFDSVLDADDKHKLVKEYEREVDRLDREEKRDAEIAKKEYNVQVRGEGIGLEIDETMPLAEKLAKLNAGIESENAQGHPENADMLRVIRDRLTSQGKTQVREAKALTKEQINNNEGDFEVRLSKLGAAFTTNKDKKAYATGLDGEHARLEKAFNKGEISKEYYAKTNLKITKAKGSGKTSPGAQWLKSAGDAFNSITKHFSKSGAPPAAQKQLTGAALKRYNNTLHDAEMKGVTLTQQQKEQARQRAIIWAQNNHVESPPVKKNGK